jgi:hypothetical protein
MMAKLGYKWCWLWVMVAWSVSARADMQVAETRWGYDGLVVPGRMNLLSVLVVNNSATAVDGELRAYRMTGLLERRGENFVQPVYVSPSASRWVQFTMWLEEGDSVVVTWGKGSRDRVTTSVARRGPPARVLLADPENPFVSGSTLKVFPDNLFPTTVAATDGLHSVVLDHAPRWEPSKREAFMDWLRKGGIVHLLHDTSGVHPKFPEDMSELNSPLDRTVVGAGLVVRHAAGRRGFGEKQLVAAGYPSPKIASEEDWESDEKGKPVRPPIVVYNLDQEILQALGGMTRPTFAWGFIYFMTLGYIVLIGPVNWLLGRKRKDYKFTVIFFGVTVAVFAAVFTAIGRRGYGESMAIHSMAHARSVGVPGMYDVTQWVGAFVTRGDDYTFEHDATHNLYATGQEYESVNGVSYNGKGGKFVVDMPLYSSRSFLHRAKLKGADLSMVVSKFDRNAADDKLTELELTVGAGFPSPMPRAWVKYRHRLYEMTKSGDRLTLARGTPGIEVSKWLSAGYDVNNFAFGGAHRLPSGEELATGKRQQEAFMTMARDYVMPRAFGGTPNMESHILHLVPDDDRLQVFVLAPMPESFRVKGDIFQKQVGYVLYHADVWVTPGVIASQTEELEGQKR